MCVVQRYCSGGRQIAERSNDGVGKECEEESVE